MSHRIERTYQSFSRKWLFWTVVAVIAVLLALATAPAFHWLWWGLFWLHPTGWSLTAIAALITMIAIVRADKGKIGCAFWGVVIPLAAFLVFYSIWSTALAQTYLVDDLMPQEISVLPETTEVRYLPMPVAEKFGENKIQESRFHLGDMDPLDQGGSIDWVAPRIPTGAINKFALQTDGFQVIRPDGQVETIHQPFKYGEGMWVTDNITWRLWRIHYNVKLPEIYYVVVDDEVLAMAPYIQYRFEFPVRVPYWGGVFVVHPSGQIEDLTPEQAMTDPRFIGQRLFPEDLALKIANAWAYKNGIGNAWFTHRDQTEVPTIEGEDNQMPYLLPTTSGPVWFVGLEPHGPAYSIFKVLLVNAHSGQIQLYNAPNESGLTGPNKAGGYVRSAFPDYQWYTKEGERSSGTIVAIEPRPFVRNGQLYWQMSVTNTDYANVARTVLVDAQNNGVVYFETLPEVEAFISGRFAGHSAVQSQALQVPTTGTTELEKMSDSDLIDLLHRIADELSRRAGQLKQSVVHVFDFWR